MVTSSMSFYHSYQIQEKCSIPAIAVGLITNLNVAEEIISNGRTDLATFGRKLLRNTYFVLNEAKARNLDIEYPKQYKTAF